MKIFLCLLFTVGFLGISSAQLEVDSEAEIISHRVLLGQTVRLIAVKYLVTPAEIYRLNKFAVEGVSEGMLLQIPIRKINFAARDSVSTSGSRSHSRKALHNANPDKRNSRILSEHIVLKGETLSKISKKYGVLVADLKRANADLNQRELRAGETIIIPAKE